MDRPLKRYGGTEKHLCNDDPFVEGLFNIKGNPLYSGGNADVWAQLMEKTPYMLWVWYEVRFQGVNFQTK